MALEFFRLYQLDIMLVLSGVCLIIGFFVFISRTLSAQRKRALLLMEVSSSLLLISDRLAYLYRGNPSDMGFWTVRISNFLVFFLTLAIIYAFNMYIIDVYTHEGGYDTIRRLDGCPNLPL